MREAGSAKMEPGWCETRLEKMLWAVSVSSAKTGAESLWTMNSGSWSMEVSGADVQVWLCQRKSQKVAVASRRQEKIQTLQEQSWLKRQRRTLDCKSEQRGAVVGPHPILLKSWLSHLENLEDFTRDLARNSDLSRVVQKPMAKWTRI